MCDHNRVRPYHGPYVSMRCPDCGRWVKGVVNRTTGYVRLREVDDQDVPRAIAFVSVRRPWMRDEGIVEGLHLRIQGQDRVQVGIDLHLMDSVEIVDSIPIERGESPWVGKLPYHSRKSPPRM